MGLLPSPETRIRDKQQRYEIMAQRALGILDEYLKV
jgi:methylenetetrahydrofolate--tRNA-(uracil-5-)-methyltransferase